MVLPRSSRGGCCTGQFRLPVSPQSGRRARVQSRIRARRVLGPAGLRGRPISGRACIHRGRCGAQPPAIRRVRPEQRPGGCGQPWMETSRQDPGLGRRCSPGFLRRGAAPCFLGDWRGLHCARHRARPRLPAAFQPWQGPGGVPSQGGRSWRKPTAGAHRPTSPIILVRPWSWDH